MRRTTTCLLLVLAAACAKSGMGAAVRTDMNQGADAVHRIESVRVQLDGIRRSVTDADVRRAAAALEEKLVELEMNLVDLRQTGGGQDGVRFGSKLIAKLGYLAGGLANRVAGVGHVRESPGWT